MEMTAAIEGLRFANGVRLDGDLSQIQDKSRDTKTVITDSQYLARGAEEWMYDWSAYGWMTAGGAPRP